MSTCVATLAELVQCTEITAVITSSVTATEIFNNKVYKFIILLRIIIINWAGSRYKSIIEWDDAMVRVKLCKHRVRGST